MRAIFLSFPEADSHKKARKSGCRHANVRLSRPLIVHEAPKSSEGGWPTSQKRDVAHLANSVGRIHRPKATSHIRFLFAILATCRLADTTRSRIRSEEHTSELQ